MRTLSAKAIEIINRYINDFVGERAGNDGDRCYYSEEIEVDNDVFVLVEFEADFTKVIEVNEPEVNYWDMWGYISVNYRYMGFCEENGYSDIDYNESHFVTSVEL